MSFEQRLLTLALHIDRHVPGYVDAYIGPPDLKEAALAQPLPAPAALRDEVAALAERVPDDDANRRAYLVAMLRAMDTSLRIVQGEEIPYESEVALIYDVTPAAVDEELFTTAHLQLDQVLPGRGTVAERNQAFDLQFEIDGRAALPLLERARAETRRRTAELVALPAGESVRLELVNDRPWSAYNWFLGDAHSLIQFNVDLPLNVTRLAGLFAHEGYPGHHTEHALKETELYRQRGYAEQAVALLHSPSAVIAEAIATTAAEIIFPGGTHHQWTAEVLLPAAGMAADPEQLAVVSDARQALRYVSANAALYFHTGRFSADQARDYIATYALSTPDRAAKSFSFIADPLYRSYVFTYTVGYDLIAAAGGSDKTTLFTRLLTRQVLPSTLSA